MLLGELKSRVGDFFSRLRGELGERELENILWDFQISLMEADVALEIAEDIVDDLRESFMKNKSRDVVKERFKEKLEEILNKAKPERGLLELISEGDKPYVILFLGVNGTGKTRSRLCSSCIRCYKACRSKRERHRPNRHSRKNAN